MQPAKNWALTQLGVGTSLELQIDSTVGTGAAAVTTTNVFAVTQFTAGWAVNEIPNAQCMLAVGREARALVAAEINRSAARLRQMRRCRVIFRPQGEFLPDGTQWPAEFLVFDGYFMGMAYNKINGKIQVVANLKHWLIDLACSSAVTTNSHPLNPAHLTARAVSADINDKGVGNPYYISKLIGESLIRSDVLNDCWGAIKKLFCALANLVGSVGAHAQAGFCGVGDAVRNDRARNALARMEGFAQLSPTTDCSLAPVYSVPLRIDLADVPDAENAIARQISDATIEGYANTTFWDKLVGEFCPSFGMAVVPAVEYALVVADTPAYRGGPWKTITTGEYDSFQMQADLERPLRAVGVVMQFGSFMGVPEGSTTKPSPVPAVGGCHAENLDEPNDGVVQYVAAPRFLQCLVTHEPWARGTTGMGQNAPSPTATTPNATGGQLAAQTATFTPAVNAVLDRYAQSIFVQNMLRGRSGIVGGKLRFDIAPGSIVTVKGSEEKFLAGEDELATDVVGCVARMTVAINAEAGIAGTTFVLSHLRTAAENGVDRTSVAQHPLFGLAIHGGGRHGAPLVAGHEDLGP
jgi:hypothetical protein